jgi:hypothetical protein
VGPELPENRGDPERADGGSSADGPPADPFATLPETEARRASTEGGDLAGDGPGLANDPGQLDQLRPEPAITVTEHVGHRWA